MAKDVARHMFHNARFTDCILDDLLNGGLVDVMAAFLPRVLIHRQERYAGY